MKYRTEKAFQVVNYLRKLRSKKKHRITLNQLSRATGVKYTTVIYIVNSLKEDNSLNVVRYDKALRENMMGFAPHALIDIKGCQIELSKKRKWLLGRKQP
ncbi:MAG: hypothetical protein ACD_15C00037G0026 [uncultured bacterium]|nr:MAG: hypothetical protein ACD_15C00037G0026 [uncultured bacterium]